MTSRATPRDIVGAWRAPDTGGVELGYYFYPDGELVMQDPRRKRFAMRGSWKLDENGQLVISDMVAPETYRSEEERELIRSERHNISIMEISRDSMVWKPEEAGERIAFRRAGELPDRAQQRFFSKWLTRAAYFMRPGNPGPASRS